jgi:arsenical pump membrane protein
VTAEAATLAIAAIATGGVIIRPFNLPEAVWAVGGALLLVIFGLLPVGDAATGVAKGTDVYLFLTGMMLLADLGRQEGLFDWLATFAVRHARGSGKWLFLLTYGVGVVVTVFLSNDATAVVLTPAVYAAAKAAGAKPLPYLLICAFVANAASFVLPISNPANLVVFGQSMPPLAAWLGEFALPSLVAIALTFAALRLNVARAITMPLRSELPPTALSRGGLLAGLGICATGLVLLTASACGVTLGLPTVCAGLATSVLVLILNRQSPWPLMRGISWSVLPLVAGLFVLVEALRKVGVIDALARLLHEAATHSLAWTAAWTGAILALGCNLTNNLPAALVAGSSLAAAQAPSPIVGAALIGVDLGPNLSITGSLATVLWLIALRREGETIDAWHFLKFGMIVMPPALIGALLALVWQAS